MFRNAMPPEVEIAILGAGPCGLGAAWRLSGENQKACTYVVMERDSKVGGSASSITTDEGFTFDMGGHVLYPHAHYSDFKTLMDSLIADWHESLPIRGVWIDRTLIPYPIQRNVHRLKLNKLIVSLLGIVNVRLSQLFKCGFTESGDLQHYLHRHFGKGLTRVALGPLNCKMWAYEPSQLSAGWTSHRSGSAAQNIPNTSLRQIAASLLTRKDNAGWTNSSLIRYPAFGGTGAIWTSLADRINENIFINTEVTGVDAVGRVLRLAGGRSVRYKKLVSTIPLDTLIDLIDNNHELKAPRSSLKFAEAGLIGFGFAGTIPAYLRSVHSFHIPQRDVQCWRVTFPSNMAPGNAPANHWSMLCEISRKSNETIDLAHASFALLDELKRCGVLPSGMAPVSIWSRHLKHGYPVPFLGRDNILNAIHEKLHTLGIFSRGRFGGWKYEVSNQDHTFMQGVEAIDFIRLKQPEATYSHPAVVN